MKSIDHAFSDASVSLVNKIFPMQGFALSRSEEDYVPEWLFVEAESPSMRAVEAVIRELAHNCVTVLLVGERGTGKRTIARRVHQNGGRLKGKFQTRDCRELTPTTLAPEVVEDGVTVYLDEIGDLNKECQDRLLELLSNQQNGAGHHDIRFICGSSHDLETEVRTGGFREDLYYQLSGVCLRIPPLRQRKEDVPHLTAFFLERYGQVFHRSVPALSAATQKLFSEYSWPGNIDELETAARTIVAIGDESVAMTGLRSMLLQPDVKVNGQKTSLKEAARAASREAEKELILKALTRTRWNRRRAAQELQISYKALLYKLKQIGYGEYEAS